MIKSNVMAILLVASVGSVQAQESAPSNIPAVVEAADAVKVARADIENAKTLLGQIPADSPVMAEVLQMLKSASENWSIAVDSLKGAQQSEAKAADASNSMVAEDFRVLAKANANVALSGAKVVQIAISYVESAAEGKTEALSTISTAMQDALAASTQVQMHYDQVKKLIAEKYSK